jgi:hypothetical protein
LEETAGEIDVTKLIQFFAKKLGDIVHSVHDKTVESICEVPNTEAAFLLETTGRVSSEIIYQLFGEFFKIPLNQIVVRNEDFVWILRANKPGLLAVVHNLSDAAGAARYFGGKIGYGGIHITLTRHANVVS